MILMIQNLRTKQVVIYLLSFNVAEQSSLHKRSCASCRANEEGRSQKKANRQALNKMPAPTSAPGTVEGPPRTELQELQLKADQTTDEVCLLIFILIEFCDNFLITSYLICNAYYSDYYFINISNFFVYAWKNSYNLNIKIFF